MNWTVFWQQKRIDSALHERDDQQGSVSTVMIVVTYMYTHTHTHTHTYTHTHTPMGTHWFQHDERIYTVSLSDNNFSLK